tara:strand:- start:371 stop:481 length:111 start_codon:yes stop_codon:yes gene_type:complete
MGRKPKRNRTKKNKKLTVKIPKQFFPFGEIKRGLII